MLLLPGPVGLDRRAVEDAGLDFVQPRLDEERNGAVPQRELGRLARALEACAEGEIELEVGNLVAEFPRLSSPPRSEPGGGARGRC
jgi:hypothetical protein